jgi:hypothetical protein
MAPSFVSLVRRSFFVLAAFFDLHTTFAQSPSVAEYKSIQAAIDANPGCMVFVPAGDYEIAKRITIKKNRSGLYGPGRIIQTNPDQPIVLVEDAADVQVRDLTLTRPEGKMETRLEGLLFQRCQDPLAENVRVIDNRSIAAGIAVRECRDAQVRACRVENYMRLSIEDRTRLPDVGYAFRCIDGSGIVVVDSVGTTVQDCRVVERHLLPTPAIKEQYQLGQFTKKNAEKGERISQEVWDGEYTNVWHQGSGIVVHGPRSVTRTQILGNQIENAAQGMDLHCDQIIVANNIVSNSFIGMKAIHGSRNVLIIGNQFVKNDLWSIGLMPGSSSAPSSPTQDGQPALEPNTDGGSLIAYNIISDFGYGNSWWIWGETGSSSPFRFNHGPKTTNPPITDVLIQGNIVYDTGRDEPLIDGQPKREPPRYKWAVRIEAGTPNSPRNLHFSGNILHPGTDGVSNVELPP